MAKATPAKSSQGSGLTKKIGPLPLWGWVAAAVVVYYVYKQTGQSSSTAQTNATQAGGGYVSGAGAGAYGGGLGSGGTGGGSGGSGGASAILSALQGIQSQLSGLQPTITQGQIPGNPGLPTPTVNVTPTPGHQDTIGANATGNPETSNGVPAFVPPNTASGAQGVKIAQSQGAPFGYSTQYSSGGTTYYGLGNPSELAAAQKAGYTITNAQAIGVPGGTTKAKFAYKA